MLRNASLSTLLNEEVSLEGLEGATLDTLWNRLAVRLKMTVPLPAQFCRSVWPLIVRQTEYEFYELPTPRKPFVVFDRLQQVDPNTGVMREPKEYPGHRFQYEPIQVEGIRGSCECFHTRQPVAREVLAGMSYQDVENRWPYSFVIVASQKMRESFIVDPNFTLDFTIIQYCMLEWIARSRFNGETSQGKYSLLQMTKDSSILYYNRKFLTEAKLITRQSLCQRTGETSIQGMVFHLPRYYTEMKPKNLIITEKVVSILKQRPEYMADYEEIKQLVLGQSEARKWFRCAEFGKYVRSDETVPYRKLYPDAEPREWKMKNCKKNSEKQVRVMRLINPEADVYDLWYQHEVLEDDQKDGILNSQKAYIDMPVLQQAYNLVASAGEQGISQTAMAGQMGLDKLNARAVVKNLLRSKAVEGHAVDEGRQRTTKYFITGMGQRSVSFDREAIQLMNTQMEQQMQQEVIPDALDTSAMQPNWQQPSTSGLAVATPSTPTIKTETSGNMSVTTTDLDEDDDDDASSSIPAPGMVPLDSPALLNTIATEVTFSQEVSLLKKQGPALSSMMKKKNISDKVLRRCNQIMELVKKHLVIEPRWLLKMIKNIEQSMGYDALVDNKTVLRLLAKLAADKFLMIANVKLVREDREQKVIYACDMSVDKDSVVLKNKIDALKTRMVMGAPGSSVPKATLPVKEDPPGVCTVGYSYQGTLAKCLRMKLLHEFLFYLLYLFPPEAKELASDEWEGSLDLDDFGEELAPIYSIDGWKIFVPPMATCESYGTGWALLANVIVRMPLSIFCQICTFGFYTKELDYYLEHPVRKHMLIKQLPKKIRQQLFRQRKYVHNICELCCKLCYAGLLQFGPQHMKDRDQIYIYLNRNTALLDTRSSKAGYNEVEEKEYPLIGFYFNTMDDLALYWQLLFQFAMETVLNRRSVAFGKEIYVQQLQVKPQIMEASKARTAHEALANDVQRLPPGDQRGAAGMDTAMFIHLKTNWSKVMNYAPAVRRGKLKRVKVAKKLMTKENKPTAGGRVGKRLTAPKDKKLCLKTKLTVKSFATNMTIMRKYGERKNAIKIRKIEARTNIRKKKHAYDEVDRKALKLMKKLRVDWNRGEDAILLICRIAVRYLYGDSLKPNTIINSQVYRDILHWSDPASTNKTSRSCQRRINYMMKNKQSTASCVKLCVEEARLNPVVEQRFGEDFLARLKAVYQSSEEVGMALKVHFVELVYLLRKTLTKLNSDHFRLATEDQSDRLIIPDSIAEFERRFNILQSHDKPEALNYDKNPQKREDIILLKLATLIHSAVCNVKEKISFNVQLFNIYKHYSERHLTQAMKMIRSFRMISLTRKLKTDRVTPGSIVPDADNPYRISISYVNQMLTKIPFEMFGMVYDNYLQLLSRDNYDEEVNFDDGSQGVMLCLAELLTVERIELDIETPTVQVVNLDEDPISEDATANLSEVLNERFQFDAACPEIKQEVPEAQEVRKKLRFETSSDVHFNYVAHPIETLTKLPTEYTHFFCLLNSFREHNYLRTYKIDDQYNVCSLPDCLLQGSDRSLIPKCIAIALARRDTIEKMKTAKSVSRLEMTPMLALREDNLVYFFTRAIGEYTREHVQHQQKDLGRIADGMKAPVNMVELADEIVRFESVRDFNWLDRYEVTHVEQAETYEAENFDYSHPSHCFEDPQEKEKRMHNFFRVANQKLKVRLLYDHPNLLQDRARFDNRNVPKIFLPPNFELRQDILTKLTEDAVWPSREELEPLYVQASPLIYQNSRLAALVSFIEQREHAGATVQELATQFHNRAELMGDLNDLINFKFILRTGFRNITYVHHQYVQPWLVRTCCLDHSRKEQQQEEEEEEGRASEVKTKLGKRPLVKEEPVEGEPPAKSRREVIERCIEEAERRERDIPKKNMSLSMTPWHKIDGTINRRLLYRWLTTVLLYCMSHPGAVLSVIYARFNMMAPVYLYYLLEILQEYGCLKMYSMSSTQKKSLFSTFRPVQIEPATEFDREESTYVEASASALTTLSMFIGDYKKFHEKFLFLRTSENQQDDDGLDEAAEEGDSTAAAATAFD